jgi:hypothetical protein
MQIMATCGNCTYPFALDELIEGAPLNGQCPSCGELFAPDYTSLLLNTVRRLEHAEGELARMLDRLASWPRIIIDEHSVVEPIRAAVRRPKRRVAPVEAVRRQFVFARE